MTPQLGRRGGPCPANPRCNWSRPRYRRTFGLPCCPPSYGRHRRHLRAGPAVLVTAPPTARFLATRTANLHSTKLRPPPTAVLLVCTPPECRLALMSRRSSAVLRLVRRCCRHPLPTCVYIPILFEDLTFLSVSQTGVRCGCLQPSIRRVGMRHRFRRIRQGFSLALSLPPLSLSLGREKCATVELTSRFFFWLQLVDAAMIPGESTV